jgi:hypothetical protein
MCQLRSISVLRLRDKRERICWTSAGDIKKKKMIDIQNSQSLIKYDEINENDEAMRVIYVYVFVGFFTGF